jgi:N-acetylmuramoyl-L-alanine amidase
MSQFTWLLDPGHGGIINGVYQTSGKRSPKLPDGRIFYEGVFNRDIVQRISNLCAENDISCINLVGTEQDLALSKRCILANSVHKQKKNCFYISVHANASGDGKSFNSANGIGTFHHFKSKKGKILAEILQKNLIKQTNLRNRGVTANDSWANFYVFRKTDMPAVLSENGFMTNLEEVASLFSSETKQNIALAHFKMILEIENNGI